MCQPPGQSFSVLAWLNSLGTANKLDLRQVYLLIIRTREGKRKTEERRKDRLVLVTLVHHIEATFKFSYSPDKISLSFLLSFFLFPLFSFSRFYD